MEVGAAAAAATAGGVGMGLFSYNRGNYMFDQKNHYARFTAGLNMAIAQTDMYKQDIAALTELTVSRQDCYHGIAAMGLTMLTAIYCPGKVGFHAPPPPGWLMGLMHVNIAGCYMFLCLTLWLAMHASMRADTAATHMLTRFVRLPIPSQGMLDKARKFLSSFEEQPLKEVFRVPFTRHDKPGQGKQGGYNEKREIDDAAAKRARHGYDVPAWYKKEKAVDNSYTMESIGSMMPLDARGTAPEHFEAYREIQHEWFPYDVYARLSIFLAFMHMTHCWAYQQIGHQFQETRAVFACFCVIMFMFVLQHSILTLDIIPRGVPFQRLGPFALWFAYIGAVCEYARWFSPGTQALGFMCVYIAYAIHIVYTLQLLSLCAPSSDAPAVAESPGASWWPGEWRLPTAFQHAIWLVAPPKELPDGQNDIVGELRAAQRGGAGPEAGATEAEKRADVHRALGKQGESPAWFNVKVGLISLVIAWIWLTFGFTIEVINQGTDHPSLLNAPGLPNNARDPRYRPAKLGLSEPTEVGTGGAFHGPAVGVHMKSLHRRLQEEEPAVDRSAIASKLSQLLPYLQGLSRTGGGAVAIPASEEQRQAVADVPVQWPALFEPEHLACGPATRPGLVAALSKHGRGSIVNIDTGAALQHFVLEGVASFGKITSATWDEVGMLLSTSTGSVLECAGSALVDGRWKCSPLVGGRLPRGAAVAVARAAQGGLTAAVAFHGESSVALFSRAGEGEWLPRAEVHTGVEGRAAAFASDASSVLFSGAGGVLVRMSLLDGGLVRVQAAEPKSAAWSGVCAAPGQRAVRLAGARVGEGYRLVMHDA